MSNLLEALEALEIQLVGPREGSPPRVNKPPVPCPGAPARPPKRPRDHELVDIEDIIPQNLFEPKPRPFYRLVIHPKFNGRNGHRNA